MVRDVGGESMMEAQSVYIDGPNPFEMISQETGLLKILVLGVAWVVIYDLTAAYAYNIVQGVEGK